METKLILAACCLLVMLAGGTLYMKTYRREGKSKKALALKGGTTLIAAVPALIAARGGDGSALWILFGIALCALADVVLELHFQGGMLAFALGHVCYVVAFLSVGGVGAVNWAGWALLSAITVLYIKTVAKGSREPLLPFMLYGVMISAMLASSLGCGPLAAIGALLFVISDSTLLYGLVREKKKGHDLAVMLTYWGAQYLIGLSALARAL